jgi:hypothetical protein
LILDDWFNPRGLFIDDQMNILTIALKKSKANILSSSEYLFVFDMTGMVKQKLRLYSDNIFDFCVHQKQIVMIRGTEKNPPMSILDF